MLSQRLAESLPSTPPQTRILIIDDSAVARAVLTRVCDECHDVTVVASLSDARSALGFLTHEQVDVILLDIDMPGIDGLSALPDLIAVAQDARVIVVSAQCAEGGVAAVQAMALGAADTLAKPAPGSFNTGFADDLAARIVRLARDIAPVIEPDPDPELRLRPFDIVAVSASTGGIHALSLMLRAIPRTMTAPILVTQHLPSSFMPFFAAQLALLAGRPSVVATDRLPILPGRVYVAPGDAHLTIVEACGQLQARLIRTSTPSGCMPSADPTLQSLARLATTRTLAVTLSGMGRDGVIGAAALAQAGGQILVQDAASSVIWGMPGAVARAGLADAVLPPERIGVLIATARR